MLWVHDALGDVAQLILVLTIAVVGCLGLLAMASPKGFARLSKVGSHWVDTSRLVSKLDQRYELDSRILPYSRPFGFVVLLSAIILGYFLLG
jgi:hypothetical protein